MTISVLTLPTGIMVLVLTVDKGGVKATKIIQILKNAQAGLELQDSTQAPKFGGLLAVPRDIANIVASNRSEAKNGLTNTRLLLSYCKS